jgi:hypothetical protein
MLIFIQDLFTKLWDSQLISSLFYSLSHVLQDGLLIGFNILGILKITFIDQDKTIRVMEKDNTSQLEKDNNTLS